MCRCNLQGGRWALAVPLKPCQASVDGQWLQTHVQGSCFTHLAPCKAPAGPPGCCQPAGTRRQTGCSRSLLQQAAFCCGNTRQAAGRAESGHVLTASLLCSVGPGRHAMARLTPVAGCHSVAPPQCSSPCRDAQADRPQHDPQLQQALHRFQLDRAGRITKAESSQAAPPELPPISPRARQAASAEVSLVSLLHLLCDALTSCSRGGLRQVA